MSELFSNEYLKKLLNSEGVSDYLEDKAKSSLDGIADRILEGRSETVQNVVRNSMDHAYEAREQAPAGELFSSDYLKQLLNADDLAGLATTHIDKTLEEHDDTVITEALKDSSASSFVEQAMEDYRAVVETDGSVTIIPPGESAQSISGSPPPPPTGAPVSQNPPSRLSNIPEIHIPSGNDANTSQDQRPSQTQFSAHQAGNQQQSAEQRQQNTSQNRPQQTRSKTQPKPQTHHKVKDRSSADFYSIDNLIDRGIDFGSGFWERNKGRLKTLFILILIVIGLAMMNGIASCPSEKSSNPYTSISKGTQNKYYY